MARISGEQLDDLIARHAAALAFYARQWTTAPDDIVQDAFTALLRREDAPDSSVAWLYGAVRRLAMQEARRETRRRAREEHAAEAKPSWTLPPGLEHAETTARMMQRLEMLPLEQREVVIARIWSELSFEDIARLTGTSSSTAHRRYVTALGQLRETLGDE